MTTREVTTGGITIMDDLSAVVARYDGKAVRLAPTFADGRPDYAPAAIETLVEGAQGPASSGGDQALTGADGWTVLTNAPEPFSNYGLGGVRGGKPLWTYPSLWPGLHASHEAAVPDRPGMIVGHTRLLGGWVTPPGEGGPMFCVNGNMGNMYLMTADGLFVSTLFHDIRLRPNWPDPPARLLVEQVHRHHQRCSQRSRTHPGQMGRFSCFPVIAEGYHVDRVGIRSGVCP